MGLRPHPSSSGEFHRSFFCGLPLRESMSSRSLSLLPFFAGNRRDGARLLSSALVFLTIGITQLDQRWGQVLTLIASVVCLYWGVAYRRLDR